MHRWKNYLFNAAIALNCLLLFLLVFENRFVVPAWLQVAGRMHPLILHFPLVLVVLYALSMIFLPPFSQKADDSYRRSTGFLLLLAVFTTVISSLAGLFLSKEEGYDPEALLWHKWGGVAISVFTLLWYGFQPLLQTKKIPNLLSAAVALFLIVFTGHQGAGITHGQNFLLAPIMPEKPQLIINPEDAIVYTHMVKPILESKCISCHNNKKAKGELVMETEELLLKGGKSGELWDTTAADLGLLLRRVHLPIEEKKHMPPQGKPQLTDQEIEIITQWIRRGSDFQLKVADLQPADTLRLLADQIFKAAEVASYDFEEADQELVKKLNTENRVVAAEALESPALSVNFFNSKLFNADQLKELDKVKKQIVTLDLAKMPLKDEDLEIISGFENLRRLNLAFTGISGAGLPALRKLKHLHTLTLSGTAVTAQQLEQLQDFPSLKTVHAWNTPVADADMKNLEQKLKNIHFETGFKGDTMILKLSPPVLLNEEHFISSPIALKLKHYIQGTTIRYTVHGSEPDSINSAEFKGGETIDGNVHIKARAYKPGWISSDIIESSFYKNTFTPDTVIYLTPAEEQYKDEKGMLLINQEKGETDFRSGGWVAFRQNRMECLLRFSNPVPVKLVSLSTLIDIGSYIMPPLSIEIWGGDDPKNLSQLGKLIPEQPKAGKPSYTKGFDCKINPSTVKYLKIIANPVAKLPAWHPGKGDKGWIFVDEILVN